MKKIKTLPLNTVLMEVVEDMVFIVNVETHGEFRYVFLNQAVFERTGLDKKALGKQFQEVHNEKIAELLIQQYEKVLSTKESVIYEDSYFSHLGEQYYSKTKLTPIFDEDGICSYIIGIVKDITDEKLTLLDKEEAWERLKESRARYRSLFNNNSDAVFTLDMDGEILSANQAAEVISGYSKDEMTETPILDYITIKTAEKVELAFQRLIEGNFSDVRVNFLHKFGEEIGTLIKLVPIETQYGLVGMYAILKDMRELDNMAQLFIDSEEKFRIIAENSHDVIVLMNIKGEITYVSPSSEQVYGLTHSDYVGKLPFHNVHPGDIAKAEELLSKAIQDAQTHTIQLRMKHKTRGWIWTEVSATPVFDEKNHYAYMMTISKDITLNKERESQLEFFAYHDSLTGLPNRRLFGERLSIELERIQGKHFPFAVFLLDIDHFKNINDKFGHEIGDAVIKEFGGRLSQVMKKNYLAARLGGDEFVLLLNQIESVKDVQKYASEIQQILNIPWFISGKLLNVTASIGISFIEQKEAQTMSSILKHADHMMYSAKEAGGNAYRICSL